MYNYGHSYDQEMRDYLLRSVFWNWRDMMAWYYAL